MCDSQCEMSIRTDCLTRQVQGAEHVTVRVQGAVTSI